MVVHNTKLNGPFYYFLMKLNDEAEYHYDLPSMCSRVNKEANKRDSNVCRGENKNEIERPFFRCVNSLMTHVTQSLERQLTP